jgi:hypothetical protein
MSTDVLYIPDGIIEVLEEARLISPEERLEILYYLHPQEVR